MEELIELLKQKQWTIGSCESMTAGLFCAELANISGASSVLAGGIVTYQTRIKEIVVGVDESVIKEEGVISLACAQQMAEKARRLLQCDICVSFSGNAGPDVMEDKPAGYVCCAIATSCKTWTFALQLQGTRNEIRTQAVTCMVKKIKEVIKPRKGDF